MKKNGAFSIVVTFLTLVFCLGHALARNTPSPGSDPQIQTASVKDTQEDSAEQRRSALEMLRSIVRMRTELMSRMVEKKKQIAGSQSETQKKLLQSELDELDKQLSGAAQDMERIATGVDIGVFSEKKTERFDWKNELLSLLEPGIMELKRLTAKARHKTELRDQLSGYEDLEPLAIKARTRIETLIAEARDPALKEELKKLLPEYRGMESQIANKLNLVRLQIADIEREDTSLIESSQKSVKNFFRTRGLFLFIALVACLGVVFFLRVGYRIVARMIPGYRAAYRPFHVRAFELVYRVLLVVLSFLAVISVFYIFEDWVLLSLAIVFLMGVGWAAKNTLPRFVHQSRLMLNIGEVREGERMMYQGVPWLVRQINFYSTLENPDLGVRLRLPIQELLNRTSRAYNPGESWFPCRKNDWVILSDGTRGCVTSLSHETVELVQRGGARKTYQTADFLGLSPLNISVNFRLKVPFGISYNLQKEATSDIPDTLGQYISTRMEAEGYKEDLLNLRVEFASAGASSLDLVVIADFKGSQAPLYNRISRAIQRWCVDAATANAWEIPFPQLDIHRRD